MAEERLASLSPEQQRVILENRAEAHLTRALKFDEQLASSKQAYAADLERIEARFDKQYKELCERAYRAKAEAFETKKKRDRVYDQEARDHAFKHARILAEIRTLKSEGSQLVGSQLELNGQLELSPELNGSSSGPDLPGAAVGGDAVGGGAISGGGDAINVSPDDSRPPPTGAAAGSSGNREEEEGPAGPQDESRP